jgi:signal peptide peptidase SppA
MRLAQILTTLQSEPLLCDNGYRIALLELFNQHQSLDRTEFKNKRTGQAKSGSELDVEDAEIRDGIAIIPVGGPMAIDLGEFEKGAGAVDMDDIASEIDEAETDDSVEAIILNFDSPGGTFNGTFELCDRIAQVEKPIYAFTRGTMCSGAYALACACDGIFATKSARVGNIGVYTTIMDLTGVAEKAGIKVKVFASGPIKGMATPGTPLTAEQEMFLKQNVVNMANVFYSHVRQTRGSITDADMGGQWYSGDEAVNRGFVDGILPDIGDLEEFLRLK